MAMRVNDGVEPIKSPPGTDRDGSRPKPPKAVAHRDSLEATRSGQIKGETTLDSQDSRFSTLFTL